MELARCHEADLKDILRVGELQPPDLASAARLLRKAAREDMGGLAQHLECGFQWQDLVLPANVEGRLQDIAFEARERASLWADPEARRLYPQGRGLVALFAGPPGTGKTMAAQVIAAALGLDLLRVDLSAVISKWVGETAQHLQRILTARSSRRAVLFFDEADALYGKRVEDVKDAQDRFANMDISHLMVALEDYDGIVFLSTNLKANIDPAFIRRIRHLVDFPRPNAQARKEIWSRAIKALFGSSVATRMAEDLDNVAALDATGAQIKNAALSAAFTVRRQGAGPDAALLGRMLAMELAKDGTGISERELQSMLDRPGSHP
jgi:SpoVK/Ycf46/Vps4 family AAA+-type ATPase